ncbi:sulfotransferase [Colwellia sp. E2M01]|uniref:sulfotransferase family protein n=1 Tax=Colwellia sp. E2M01 TaxID=2841561 RepID=UPI001C086481|nr:sulfotransferase [Colwellia sp. E2M01]MBU2869208.1 sulfotransferase [Colwellia sp. E2M01]
MPELIFIIGPARSGTHLVASTLNRALPNATYLAEINEFWLKYSIPGQDKVDPKFLTTEYLNKIRVEFLTLAGNAELIIEKTASNSLRIGFIKALFPNASLIFLHRDGLQVVKSVLKKQKGNINKISNSKTVSLIQRFTLLFSRIKAKFLKIKVTPKNLFLLCKENMANVLNILNLKNDVHWGPKFCSKKSRSQILHPEIYAFMQWGACTQSINDSMVGLHDKSDYLSLNFEDVIKDHRNSAAELNSFLAIDSVIFDIDISADTDVKPKDLEFYTILKQLSHSFEEKECR